MPRILHEARDIHGAPDIGTEGELYLNVVGAEGRDGRDLGSRGSWRLQSQHGLQRRI